MSKYLDVDGYHIKKDKLDEDEYKNIKNKLTVSPFSSEYNEEVVVYKQYKTTYDEIIIPKFFGIDRFGYPKKSKHEPLSAKIPFLMELRDYQKPIVNICLDSIQDNGGCQLSVPCGRGKTVMAIYLAHKLGLKTLILVHKSFLQKQWFDRIKQYTGEDAGLIRQDKAEIKGYMFCVAMVQSLSSRDYGDVFRNFGIVICDECHHYGSEQFSFALSEVSGAAYTLGLSATPYRKDGLTKVVFWHLGDIAYKETIKANNQVYVKVLTYMSTDTERFVEKFRGRAKGRVLLDSVKMVNNLVDIKSRNNLIVNVVDYLRKQRDRKILILSGRRDSHVNMLKERIDKLIDDDVKTGQIVRGECVTAFYTGCTKEKERTFAEKYADVLFATYGMAEEGLDIEGLNTLILATPKKDVNQAVGRIMRKVLKNGDVCPLVIDIADHLSLFKSQIRSREEFYEKNKYQMKYYYFLDDKLISPRKFKQFDGHTSDDYCNNVPTLDHVLSVPAVDLSCFDNDSTGSDDSKSSRRSTKDKMKSMFSV
jgi:Mimiviridae putative ATP-dependent RNA helicase